jgi:hypothetical protein
MFVLYRIAVSKELSPPIPAISALRTCMKVSKLVLLKKSGILRNENTPLRQTPQTRNFRDGKASKRKYDYDLTLQGGVFGNILHYSSRQFTQIGH